MPGESRPGNRWAGTIFPAGCLLLAAWCLVGCKPAEPDLTWRRVQAQGVVRVGMEANWVPFEYVDGSGQLTGFDVELARALGARLGLQVQFYPTLSFDGLYDALTADRVDVVISAVVVDPGRRADFAYSIPYFDAGQVLVGSTGAGSGQIHEMRDLRGRVLAVELGSQGDLVARRWARRLAGLTLLHADSASAALDAVAQGRADAALTDRASALMALKASPESRLQIVGEPVTGEQYAAVVRRDSEQLLEALNEALVEMQADGTLEALETKWLGP